MTRDELLTKRDVGSHRLTHTLSRFGVRTWADIAEMSEADLLKINGFGRIALERVRAGMSERGLAFQCRRGILFGARLCALPTICGVYFIQCEQFVKIGYSKNIYKRFDGIAAANPHKCTLLGYIETDSENEARDMEQSLHKLFDDEHHAAEWYRQSERIGQFVLEHACLPS